MPKLLSHPIPGPLCHAFFPLRAALVREKVFAACMTNAVPHRLPRVSRSGRPGLIPQGQGACV